MSTPKTLYVGMDLCRDAIQLSCCRALEEEPHSICQNKEKEVFLIPAVLAYRRDTGEWFFGEDALLKSEEGKAEKIDHIFDYISQDVTVWTQEKEVSASELLSQVLSKSLYLLKSYYPNDSICSLVVTLTECNFTLIRLIYECLIKMGLERKRIHVTTHDDSFMYYALSQDEKLWGNDVGLFEMTPNGLFYHQLHITKRTNPMAAGVDSKDCSQYFNETLLKEWGGAEKIQRFLELSRHLLHKQLLLTIYLTGSVFEEEWAKGIYGELCSGRRLFIGQNLYTKGACYQAMAADGCRKTPDMILMTENMVTADISIRAYQDGRMQDIRMISTGMPWYEADHSVDLLSDDCTSLEIMISDMLRKSNVDYTLELGKIYQRPPKTTRLRLRIRFVDEKTFVISLKDVGFGSGFPSNYRIWEKTIRLT